MCHQMQKGLKNWPAQLAIMQSLLSFAAFIVENGVCMQEIQDTVNSVGQQAMAKRDAIAAQKR